MADQPFNARFRATVHAKPVPHSSQMIIWELCQMSAETGLPICSGCAPRAPELRLGQAFQPQLSAVVFASPPAFVFEICPLAVELPLE